MLKNDVMPFYAPDDDPGSTGFVGFNDTVEETPPVVTEVPEISSHLRTLIIFVIVDISGSMQGNRIAAVNEAMRSIVETLHTRQDADAAYALSILTFSETAKWVTAQGPIPVQDFVFEDFTTVPWITNYGAAFDALEEKLHRGRFLEQGSKEYYYPMFLFVTDGAPTDEGAYPTALARLNKNAWFANGTKYAIAVGEDSRTDVVRKTLAEFCGNKNNVRYAEDGDAICGLIQKIVVRGSKIASRISSGSAGQSAANADSVPSDNGLYNKPDPQIWDNLFEMG